MFCSAGVTPSPKHIRVPPCWTSNGCATDARLHPNMEIPAKIARVQGKQPLDGFKAGQGNIMAAAYLSLHVVPRPRPSRLVEYQRSSARRAGGIVCGEESVLPLKRVGSLRVERAAARCSAEFEVLERQTALFGPEWRSLAPLRGHFSLELSGMLLLLGAGCFRPEANLIYSELVREATFSMIWQDVAKSDSVGLSS